MTKLSRRGFMHFAAVAAGLPTIASAAWAQTCGYRAAVGAARVALTARREKSVIRTVIIAMSAALGLGSSVAFAQQASYSTASIPDFSGIWTHLSFPGFEPPPSGPGPVLNKSRIRGGPQDGRGNIRQFVGDYSNPILKPHAAEVVRQHGEISLTGVAYPTPSNTCWPAGVPYIFWNGIQLLQQPHQITIIYFYDHEVRRVRMNEPHPARVVQSWYGDSVGHYEGDTLVIDTVGIKQGPFAMVDMYGTPHTEALHVVERYRLIDYESAKEGWERDAKENFQVTSGDDWPAADPNYKGKELQLEFTVEDEGVFTMPWSATITYRRALELWVEIVCAENTHEYYARKDAPVPTADRPDF